MTAAAQFEVSANLPTSLKRTNAENLKTPLYSREDWTLFRALATLCQKAGVAQDHLVRLIAKELVDNSLDAAGDCQIDLLTGENGFWIADSGSGIPGTDEEIADLFSIRRPLTSSKMLRKPSRGALGNGLRVVAGACLSTGGDIVVCTNGRRLKFTPLDDGSTKVERLGAWSGSGTRIEVRLGITLKVSSAALDWAAYAIAFNTGAGYLGKASAYWYDADAFFELLQAAGKRPVRDFVTDFDGCTGAKAGKIAAQFLGCSADSLSREEADSLLRAMLANSKPVKADRLGRIGERSEFGSYATASGVFERSSGRAHQVAQIPFVIEAWVSLQDSADILALVNKTPITARLQAWHTANDLYLNGCGLFHSFSVGRQAARVVLNVQTPYMPITSDGKAPDLEPFVGLIAATVKAAINRAKRGKARSYDKVLSQKDVILASVADAVQKASSGGRYPFSQRQLYYVLRPAVQEACGKELDYGYFCGVLTEYENTHGDIGGMYRDPRGILYHPHTGEEIALGTKAVERYSRPAWTFNKVLYIEKEGLFAALRAERWPERYDCALVSSKGQATRAAKDLLDLLGDSEEPVTFYCIHDADAAGTMIYQSLQNETKSRPGRRVQIVNFGLEPEEALAMGLEAENVKYSQRQPVADYVPANWATWLQTHRVELNEMTTEKLLQWLDGKMATANSVKVEPLLGGVQNRLSIAYEAVLRAQKTANILAEAGFEPQIQADLAAAKPVIEARTPEAIAYMEASLTENPYELWSQPIERFAETLVREGGAL